MKYGHTKYHCIVYGSLRRANACSAKTFGTVCDSQVESISVFINQFWAAKSVRILTTQVKAGKLNALQSEPQRAGLNVHANLSAIYHAY